MGMTGGAPIMYTMDNNWFNSFESEIKTDRDFT